VASKNPKPPGHFGNFWCDNLVRHSKAIDYKNHNRQIGFCPIVQFPVLGHLTPTKVFRIGLLSVFLRETRLA
jgi:hypothetical protein